MENKSFEAENGAPLPATENGVDYPSVVFEPESGSKHRQQNAANGDTTDVISDPTENNKDEKKKEDKEKKKMNGVPVIQLFRYAESIDKFLLVIAVFGAIAHGVAMPVQFIIFGELIDAFVQFDFQKNQNGTLPNLEGILTDLSLYYVYLAIGTLILAYLQSGFFSHTAFQQAKRIRHHFFQAVMRQNIGWFDTYETGELNTRLTEDIRKVIDGIGPKIGLAIQYTVTFFTGLIIGFVYSWKMTLVILAMSPLLVLAGAVIGQVVTVLTNKELDAYAKAGAIAEEVFSSMRTVAAFGGEEKENKRYESHLGEAKAFGIKKGLSTGVGFGFFYIIFFGSFAIAFWYGAKLVVEGDDGMNAGDLLVVFFAVLVGATQLGQTAPNVTAIATAKVAAYELFSIIDRVPPINSSSNDGEKPANVMGDIEFKDIHFIYPSRPDIKILNGLNLSVSSGQTVALVGESGCGKSTIIKLVQRFYDPDSGSVSLDGKDIRSLNLQWLREHIGVVSQEPVLFATTIAENIRYGKDGLTQAEIEQAAKMANAHDFITKLPRGYETLVGERGAQLSGGQKQRVAIARAVVRNPRILILDEATSALDTQSEGIVQAALDRAREGRTTLVIAHRLSTVRNANIIAAIQEGLVVETGSHNELMATDGVYRQLVTLQAFEEEKEDEVGDNDDIQEDTQTKETKAAVKFVRSMSNMSSDDGEHASPELHRRVSVRASRRLSAKRRPSSALSRSDSHAGKIIEEKVEPAPFLRVIKTNSAEWPYMLFGTLSALANGMLPMAFALLLGEILNIFTHKDKEKTKEESVFWSLMFLVMGGASFFTNFFQNYMFAISGEMLTLRLRRMTFRALLRQEMAYFDDPMHATGALTTALSTHASDVKGAAGARLGTFAVGISTIIASLIYSFYNGWMLTLVVLAFIPFLCIGGALEIKGYEGDAGGHDAFIESGKVAVEAFENVRTIVTLGRERTFFQKYASSLVLPHRAAIRRAHLFGLSYGVTEAVTYFCNAACFRFGAYLVVKGDMNMMEVMKVVMCISISGMVLGETFAFSADYAKAKVAAARIFKILDRVQPIDSSSQDGLAPSGVQGTIQLHNVRFRYPTRTDVKVLRGMTLEVKQGQTLALVGPSGCGKSTVVSLLERFYDAEEGEVAIDNTDVSKLNIAWLRSKMGIVSQEPVLFGYSIAENIAYGDNSRQVPMDEIEAAAKAANIHNFINGLPKGYDTEVGDKGTLISGGQKQRIAIARALVRNPGILLLDEATSALDTESEKVVQEALDAASEGRTVIMIAHRLTTVKNADVIAVIDRGRVVEQGTHQELIALDGIYTGLVNAQKITGNTE